jgi:hypothetical protein
MGSAERRHVSPILTIIAFAMMVARYAVSKTPPDRGPSYFLSEAKVFFLTCSLPCGWDFRRESSFSVFMEWISCRR